MQRDDIAFLAVMLRRRSGLMLANPKPHAIEGKLAPVVRRFGFKNAASLVAELRHGHDALARAVTEAMTTNDSSFFRDRVAFDHLRETILPTLIRRRAATKRLRIWSAACASGQEPYSIAMTLDDLKLQSEGWTVDLIATDLNSQMVARAEHGVFSHFEVQRGLPIRRLIAHFTQDGHDWRIAEPLRRMVRFRQFNLLDSYGWLDDIDLILCRNVLMYFEPRIRSGVLERAAEILIGDGYLMLGPAEGTEGSAFFAPAGQMRGVYVKAGKPAARTAAG